MASQTATLLLSFPTRIQTIPGGVRKDIREVWNRDIVVIREDRIVVSDFSNGLKLFDSQGSPLSKIPSVPLVSAVTSLSPTLIASTINFDSDPSTVIATVDLDIGEMKVLKTISTTIHFRGIAGIDERTWAASTAWWNGGGGIYVMNDDGEVERSYNYPAESKCMLECSSHMAVSPTGDFIASDGNAGTVVKVDPKADGNPVKFVYDGKKNQTLELPLGVACDAQCRIYVADQGLHRVLVLSPDGTYIQTIVDFNQLREPTGVCVFEDKLYVVEKVGSVKVFQLAEQ
ncbi:uncharacterized protein LOC124268068 [Haliotis rubra]|uniref:uncharacterized protein LOC124268068 n=1 Tax=Haliotis rubra TaxID=36100 RepID=UPI001EE51F05|nr:uncharacterized protein LOC124268068 [Haliotis rubra]XP_046559045.1 uncharacterized protein LOC124268068 [Haliotis rubra]